MIYQDKNGVSTRSTGGGKAGSKLTRRGGEEGEEGKVVVVRSEKRLELVFFPPFSPGRKALRDQQGP